MNDLLDIFPFVKKSQLDFQYYNKLLNKVTLTGKINSDENTTNLFQFADQTNNNFVDIKNNLMRLLLEENINKLSEELQSKAQNLIDTLIRNLFERTADVGFLATDSTIIDFFANSSSEKLQQSLHARLKEYQLKYSVYNEIIIFDTEGRVKLNLNKENKIYRTSDPIIEETLQSDSYVERIAYSDIFRSQTQTLTYTQKILNEGETLGVLCLCFKFEDELQRLFSSFEKENETIVLAQNSKVILSNNSNKFKLNSSIKLPKKPYEIRNNSVVVSAKTGGYQGYSGLEWHLIFIYNPRATSQADTKEELLKHSFINRDVQEIITQADNIVEDLADIIINGELIAAKERVYLLNPILDNLRIISNNLLDTIKKAAQNLEYLVQSSLKHNLLSASKLAIDILDRNLYERANDSRWWALTPLFIEELKKESLAIDRVKLNKSLLYINNLYTVYTNIFIYDKSGTIVASSKDSSIIGTKITSNVTQDVYKNSNTQHYFVSDFEPTPYYNGEATYIYHASISSQKKSLGGIAVVFDSTIEFQAILQETKVEAIPSTSLFIDREARVLSCSDNSVEILSIFPFDRETLEAINRAKTLYRVIKVEDKEYLLASASSKGYREYKVSDNYRNPLFSITLVPLQKLL